MGKNVSRKVRKVRVVSLLHGRVPVCRVVTRVHEQIEPMTAGFLPLCQMKQCNSSLLHLK